MWVKSLAGEKALIADADRDKWALHGWLPTDEPGETEPVFVWMTHPDVGRPAPIVWAARDYWQGIGFVPSPPAEPVNPTKDPVLTDVTPGSAAAKPAAKKSSAAPAAPSKES